MLVLTRKQGEEIVIEGGVTIRVVALQGQRVRIGIEAPADVAIWRAELPAVNHQPPTPRAKRPSAGLSALVRRRTLARTAGTLAK